MLKTNIVLCHVEKIKSEPMMFVKIIVVYYFYMGYTKVGLHKMLILLQNRGSDRLAAGS